MRKKMFLLFILNAILLPSLLISKAYYHSNGQLSWDGCKSPAIYAGVGYESSAIYHSNGEKAWDGSKYSAVYHSNGKKAWGGQYSDIYHSNGQKAWGGKYSAFYHSNGKKAWGGSKYDAVYHSNGKKAWDGNSNGKIYSENGKCLGTSDYCQIWLSNEWLLTVQPGCNFYLAMPITDELWFYVSENRISWEELAMIRSFNTVYWFDL